MHKTFITVMLFVLAAMTANPAMSGGEPPPPTVTVSDCQTGWNSSAASNSCTRYHTSVTDNKCNFGAWCTFPTSTGDDRGQFGITGVSESDASRLSFCTSSSDRALRVGSC
ncbi:MAG: hypothetical protein OXC41_02125 [Gammaproteobacteria bacterium]|nr:hypothetical protein [Gammaproteobacteria bacterium]